MSPPKLHLGGDLQLPLNVVTRRTAILGQTGTGKTSTAVVLVEEAARAGARYVVIDPTGAWFGLKSSVDGEGPGLDCVVMGGQHGDVPLDEHAGAAVAELVAEEGYDLVLDLERLHGWAARQRFVADFLTALYERSHSQILVVMDEAHRFAPQTIRDQNGHAARCLGAVNDIVGLGRRKGVGILVITQRLAKLNKDVLELCEILISHRLRGTNDQKALRAWIEETDQDIKPLLREIAELADGVARVSAPTLGINGTFPIRRKQTFDSSRSIDVGEVAIEPKVRSDVDMGALEKRLGALIEKAEAEDPRALRARIAELEEQLRSDAAPAAPAREVEIPVLPRARFDQIESLVSDTQRRSAALASQIAKATERAQAEIVTATRAVEDAIAELRDDMARALGAAPAPARASAGAARSNGRKDAAPPAVAAAPTQNGEGPIRAGGRRMLSALVRMEPDWLTRDQVAVLAGMKRSGTFDRYLSDLRARGAVVENGNQLRASPGVASQLLGGAQSQSRPTPAEILGMWRETLRLGARRMLDALVEAYPEYLTRDELAARAEMERSGTFDRYLSDLRRTNLIEEEGRTRLRASATTLFLEAAKC